MRLSACDDGPGKVTYEPQNTNPQERVLAVAFSALIKNLTLRPSRPSVTEQIGVVLNGDIKPVVSGLLQGPSEEAIMGCAKRLRSVFRTSIAHLDLKSGSTKRKGSLTADSNGTTATEDRNSGFRQRLF